MRHLFALAVMGLLAVGCGHATHVRPTPKGKLALEGTLGGPVAKVSGLVIPLPLSTVGGSYGVSDLADVHAHVHGTALAFGVAGLDIGGSYMPVQQKGLIPALTLTGRFYGFTDFKGFAPYLELTGAGSYLVGKYFLLYASASSLVQTSNWPLYSLGVGNEFQFGDFGLQVEGRWYQPQMVTTFNVVDWQSFGGRGAWGALVALRYRFDMQKEASK